MHKSESTRRAIRSIAERALSPDEVEDHFHDAIVSELLKHNDPEQRLHFIFSAVRKRIELGWGSHHSKESKQYLQLNEEITQDPNPLSPSLQIDIRDALAQLSPLQQKYIYLYYYEGYTIVEIATQYRVTHQAVTRVLHRGLGQMKIYLTKGARHEEDD